MARSTYVKEGRQFYGRRTRGDLQGPVLVDIVITQTRREDGVLCHPSYYVYVDGQHVCGGFADHLPERWEDSSVGRAWNLVPR